ncbi:hypothetical protein JYT72_01650 [Crocinitomix catalasitica]|nr:hypothetical protein [Crocinitomix catalasitica]
MAQRPKSLKQPNNTKTYPTSNGYFRLTEDGILIFVYEKNAKDTLETAKENVTLGIELTNNKPYLILIDQRNVTDNSKAARNYYAHSDEVKSCIGVALLVDSGLSRVIGNFFIGLNKPPRPAKLFANEEMGLIWLRKHLINGEKL